MAECTHSDYSPRISLRSPGKSTVNPLFTSRQNLAYRLPALRRRVRPSRPVVELHMRIDAQALINCGTDISGSNREIFDIGGVGVGGAVDSAAADAGPSKEHGIAIGPVVAA